MRLANQAIFGEAPKFQLKNPCTSNPLFQLANMKTTSIAFFLLFNTPHPTNLSQLESVLSLLERELPHHPDSEKFKELAMEKTVESVSSYVRSPGRLGSHRD